MMYSQLAICHAGIQLKTRRKQQDVCEAGLVHRGVVRPSRTATFQLWFAGGDRTTKFNFTCFAWCTGDGSVPAGDVAAGDRPGVDVLKRAIEEKIPVRQLYNHTERGPFFISPGTIYHVAISGDDFADSDKITMRHLRCKVRRAGIALLKCVSS